MDIYEYIRVHIFIDANLMIIGNLYPIVGTGPCCGGARVFVYYFRTEH